MDDKNQSPDSPLTSRELSASSDTAPQHSFENPDPIEEPSKLSEIAGGFSSVMGAIFSWVIFPVAVVLILHNFVFQAYHVLGTSMVNTLHETDYLIIC